MNDIEQCLSYLEKIENRSFRGKNRIVIDVFDVKNLVDCFCSLEKDEKKMLTDCVSERSGRNIISFTKEMGEQAIETGDMSWLRKAFLAHIIEGVKFDYRENLRELYSLTPAIEKLGTSWNELWKSVEEDASDRVKEYLIKKTIDTEAPKGNV